MIRILSLFGVLVLAALSLFFPDVVFAQTELVPDSDGETLSGIHGALAVATATTIDNLNDPAGFVNQAANIIWRTVTFILLIWIMFQYIWGEVSITGILYFIIYSFFIYAFINLQYNGTQMFTYITNAYLTTILFWSDEIFALTTGTTLENFTAWMVVMPSKLVITGSECGVFCIANLVTAVAGAILTIAFGLLVAVAYIVKILTEMGFAIILALGLLTVPLALFQFGQGIFFAWLRAVTSFTFTLLFIGVLMGLVANMLAGYFGVNPASMQPNFWSGTNIIYDINSFDDIWAPFFVSIIGITSLFSAASWGSMIGGAAISGTSGIRNAAVTKLFLR